MKVLNHLDDAPIENSAKLLRFGLMEKQPEITEKDCEEIYNKIAEINTNKENEEEIRIGEITEFIINQYLAFSGAPTGKKKQKKLEIVEM